MADAGVGYKEIADLIRAELLTPGAFPPGTVIETQHELAKRFQVNRGTVEKALAVLIGEGLLESNRARGTRVPWPQVHITVARAIADALDPKRELSRLGPWETALRHHGLTGHGRVHAVTREKATAEVAAMLGIAEGDEVVGRYRNPTIDGVGPAQIQRAWMPAALVDGTPLADPGDVLGGVYACMKLHGMEPSWFDERVSARVGMGPELAVLNRPAGSVVLAVWRTTFDVSGRAVEALHIVADARLIDFSYRQSLGDVG